MKLTLKTILFYLVFKSLSQNPHNKSI